MFFFWCTPLGYLNFLTLHLLNEPGLGAGIDSGMALIPFPSSIEWDSNPPPFNCEWTSLPKYCYYNRIYINTLTTLIKSLFDSTNCLTHHFTKVIFFYSASWKNEDICIIWQFIFSNYSLIRSFLNIN